jgi:hypothetical protein
LDDALIISRSQSPAANWACADPEAMVLQINTTAVSVLRTPVILVIPMEFGLTSPLMLISLAGRIAIAACSTLLEGLTLRLLAMLGALQRVAVMSGRLGRLNGDHVRMIAGNLQKAG